MKNLKKFQEFALTQEEQKNTLGAKRLGGGCVLAPAGTELEWTWTDGGGGHHRSYGSSLAYMECATQHPITSTTWCN